MHVAMTSLSANKQGEEPRLPSGHTGRGRRIPRTRARSRRVISLAILAAAAAGSVRYAVSITGRHDIEMQMTRAICRNDGAAVARLLRSGADPNALLADPRDPPVTKDGLVVKLLTRMGMDRLAGQRGLQPCVVLAVRYYRVRTL